MASITHIKQVDLPNPHSSGLAFKFDSLKADILKEKINQHNLFVDRINRLITEPHLNGIPVISFILEQIKYDFDPEELATVGRAFQRIAVLWADFIKSQNEVQALLYAYQNPNAFALTFGDFESPDPSFFTVDKQNG